jgi:ribosomal protein L7/L12
VRGESRRNQVIHLLQQAARWRARSNRQIWLMTVALMIVTCASAVAVPSMRPTMLGGVLGLAATGYFATASQRSRHEHEALVVRLATQPRDDIPADVIDLVLAGKKIQAIKRYRAMTGTSLAEAKALIDGL